MFTRGKRKSPPIDKNRWSSDRIEMFPVVVTRGYTGTSFLTAYKAAVEWDKE